MMPFFPTACARATRNLFSRPSTTGDAAAEMEEGAIRGVTATPPSCF